MNLEDFSKYTSIMYNSDPDNKVIKKIKNFYYNRNLMKLSDKEIKKIEEIRELQNIKDTIILEENVGNLYDYIKNNASSSDFDVRGYILSQYTFKPRLNYEKYSDSNSNFFNTLQQGVKEYIKITEKDVNKEIYSEDNIYKIMTDLMRTKNGEVYLVPKTFILVEGYKNNIFNSSLDSLALSTLNGTLFNISESDISMFFNVLANLNYYVLNEKLEEFKKTLINDIESDMANIGSLISEFKSFFNKDDNHFNELLNASGNLWNSISNFIKYYSINEENVYPGMYTHEAFKILEEIVTSDMFYLDSVKNISLFTVYDVCKGYFNSTTDNSKVEEYNKLKEYAKKFVNLYNNIRKRIIESGKFEYTKLTLDE